MFNWEMHVHFKVHGQAGALYGDGLALWYAKERLELGPVFGNRNLFNGIAIFLDTYSNHNGPHGHGHPYISAMVNNGSLGYDHDRDGTHTELAGCTCHFRGVKQETYIAVRYERQKLTVSTDIDGKNTWKSCFSVDHVRLPKGYFFGATAATGDLSDNHDIISIKVYDIGGDDTPVEEEKVAPDSPSADFFAPPRDHVEDVKPTTMFSGWRLLLVILLLVVGGGVCLVVGYSIFAKRYEDRRKRFY